MGPGHQHEGFAVSLTAFPQKTASKLERSQAEVSEHLQQILQTAQHKQMDSFGSLLRQLMNV